MQTIRHNVFETNSSSTHSITIGNTTVEEKDLLPINEDGNIYVDMKGYYGETETVRSFERKLAHILVLSEAIDLYFYGTDQEVQRNDEAIAAHKQIKDAVISVYRSIGITTPINDVVMVYKDNDDNIRYIKSTDKSYYIPSLTYVDADGCYNFMYSNSTIVNLLLYSNSFISISGDD